MTPPADDTVPFKTILVATDFHACSKRAVERAAQLAKASDGKLFMVHTFEPPAYAYGSAEFSACDWITPMQDAARQSLNSAVQALCERGVRADGVLCVGAAWEHILLVAKQVEADVIVLGTHGRRGVMHALLGSVAEKVVRMAAVPVLTVRSGEAL